MWNPLSFVYDKLSSACWGVRDKDDGPEGDEPAVDSDTAAVQIASLKKVLHDQRAKLSNRHDDDGLDPLLLLRTHNEIASLRLARNRLPNALYHFRKMRQLPPLLAGRKAWDDVSSSDDVQQLLQHADSMAHQLAPLVQAEAQAKRERAGLEPHDSPGSGSGSGSGAGSVASSSDVRE